MRISPRDPRTFLWMSFNAAAKSNSLGADEEAVAWLRRSIETNRNYPTAHFALAAISAKPGRAPTGSAPLTAAS